MVVRAFEEEGDNLKTDSPTCVSEGMKMVLTLIMKKVRRQDTGCKYGLFAR